MTDQPHGPDCSCPPDGRLADDVTDVTASSLIAANADGRTAAFVRLTVTLADGTTVASDVPPDQARQIGRHLIEGATAAEYDVGLYRLLTEALEVDVATAGAIIGDLARFHPAAGSAEDAHPANAHLRRARDN